MSSSTAPAIAEHNTHGTARPKVNKAMRRKIITASLVGTTIEFYDFYAYATAAGCGIPPPVLPQK